MTKRYVGAELRQQLLSNNDLTSIIDDRIYPGGLPGNENKSISEVLPAVSYWQLPGNSRHHDIPIAFPVYQFDCWSERYSEIEQIAAEVLNTFQRFKGDMFGVTVIQGVHGEDENEEDAYNQELGLYHKVIEIKIIFREE